MNKTRKILTILIILLLLMLNCLNVAKVYATQSKVPNVNYYKPNEEAIPNEVTDVGGTIVSILQVVGTVIAVITLMIMGVKYMMAGVEEKADYKKTMIPYLIGCVLLFATVTIINAVYQLISPLNQL